MREAAIQLFSGSEHEDRPCHHCRAPLASGDNMIVCPRCKAPHHVPCWRDRGGCARHGCPQVAEVFLPTAPRRDAPLPSLSRRQLVLGAAGIIILLAGLIISWTQQVPATSQPVLSMMTTAGPTESPHVEAAVSDFQQARSDIRLDLQIVPFVGYEQKLLVLIAVQDGPDIFSLPMERLSIYAENGAFLPLDNAGWEVEAFVTHVLPAERRAEGVIGGVRYGVPHPSRRDVIGISAQTAMPEKAWEFLRHLLVSLPLIEDPEGLPDDAPPSWAPFPGTGGF